MTNISKKNIFKKTIVNYPLLLALVISTPAWGAIYRTVDASGNVTYTDQPPPNSANSASNASSAGSVSGVSAEKIEVAPANTFENKTERALWEPDSIASGDADGEEASPANYQLAITSPANDAAMRENAGNVAVRTEINPELREGDVARLELNGALTEDASSDGAFILTNVSRGTHQVRVVVENAEGKRLAQSSDIEFHLQRTSLFQPRRPPPRSR